MKRFIFSILCVSVFFIGVGSLVERTGAKFKSDEKALALIAKARQAIGGDAAVSSVQSMVIVGKTTRQMKLNGVSQPQDGETEIALQFPDKMSRTIKMGNADGTDDTVKFVDKQVDVVVMGGDKDNMKVIVNGEGEGTGANISKKIIVKKDDGSVQELTGADADKWIAEHPGVAGEKHIIIKKGDGSEEEISGGTIGNVIVNKGGSGTATFTSKDGKTFTLDGDHQIMINRVGGEGHHDAMRHNELLRLTLGLLLTAPQGMDVSYTFGGESSVDGTACNIVVAEFGGSSFKIYLGQTSNLPVMMTYKGLPMPTVMNFRTKDPNAVGEPKDTMVFTRKIEGPAADSVEYSVKFSDYRSTGGIQFPYKWTQTVGGATDETFDVTSYEVNPANIAEKFKNQKVMVRMKKPDVQ
ncbi:MAG: hypothetical protein ACKVQJ_04155 [Pyrinomonadaceae bacterium]